MPEVMEEIVDSIESLMESAADFGKTSFNLAKLKTVAKTTDVASSIIPHAIVFLIFMSSLFFLSLGAAYYLGEILENLLYGLMIVAAFYLIVGLVVHFLLHDLIKRKISDFIIKQALK